MPMLQVVVAIDHRVLGVVGEHPEQVAAEQPPGDAGHGGVGRVPPRTAANAIGMPKLNAMPSTACGIDEDALGEGVDDA